MADTKKTDTEEVLDTEEVKQNGTEEVQDGGKQTLKDKIDEVLTSVKEQGEKTATKKDVWKAALTNATIVIGSIVIGVVFGV
jgi:hypothetical protein